MSREKGNFEDLFKDAFNGYTVIPTQGLWSKIMTKVQIRQFFKFNLTSINIFYVGAILTGSVIAYSVINNNDQNIVNDNIPTVVAEDIITEDEQLIIPEINKEADEANEADLENINLEKSIIEKEINTVKANSKENNNVTLQANNNKNTKDNIEKVIIKEDKKEDRKIKDNKILVVPDTIKKVPEAPMANFLISTDKLCVDDEIQFTNTSKKAIEYRWDFGDGKFSNRKNPQHTYSKGGNYDVCLKIKGDDDEYYLDCKTITINKRPVASFEIDDFNSDFDNKIVYFNNLSENNKNNKWDFGDNNISFERNPSHFYNKQDEYFVKLLVNDGKGCVDSTIFKISFLKAKYYIEFPNAFAPSLSGPAHEYVSPGESVDELFYPIYKGVSEFNLYVYDRSGLVLFQSNDINHGWNGYYKGKIVNRGVYIYECSGKYQNGDSFLSKGTVTVIHKN